MMGLVCWGPEALALQGESPDWWQLYQQQQAELGAVPLPEESLTLSLRELDGEPIQRVDGLKSRLNIGFGSRADELVETATLYLDFHYSPTLAGDVSQLRVHFNNELIGSIHLPAEGSNVKHEYQFEVPAEYFSRYNEVQFELLAEAIGYTCTVISPSAWLEFYRSSRIELTKKKLVLANDLSWFPEPFVDERDFNPVDLHYVLPEQITPEFAQAAGIMSSYLGMKAKWRGVTTHRTSFRNVPIIQDTNSMLEHKALLPNLPEQHAIVLMTNSQKPWQLYDIEPVTEPTVRMITNPQNKIYKLLLVHTPTAAELTKAVQALASEELLMSGPVAIVHDIEVEPRAPYSAPNWVTTERPVQFSELVEFESELQRSGYRTAPVKLNLVLPPDLFLGRREAVPVDLRFRYTPPTQKDESRLRVYVNDEFIQGYMLDETGFGGSNQRIRIPVIGENPFAEAALEIPAFKLGVVNTLEFDFSFSALTEECRVAPLSNTVGSIDGSSEIDLRGYEHYTEMPNLHLFAKSGYPFSRYDDLSKTTMVVSDSMTDNEFELAMDSLAMMGAYTGYHGSLLTVKAVADISAETDHDMLIIGGDALSQWVSRFGRKAFDAQLNLYGLAGKRDLFFSDNEQVTNTGPTGAVVSFESPLHQGATVVALTANQDSFLPKVGELLGSVEQTNAMKGFMSLVTPGDTRHFESQYNYYVGQLSWFERLQYHVARYPLVVALVTLLALITLILAIYWSLSRLARSRKQVV
ncbi:cellulose biosynthesis cyclic di-GMP-binding regulatory protein BcsB [Aliidiomarina taiwanensis]|nr:cellulose biosynthesis cyclic di-GMP-binding regulatory protein BcsB [Aliidiomarina taiwanensis]